MKLRKLQRANALGSNPGKTMTTALRRTLGGNFAMRRVSHTSHHKIASQGSSKCSRHGLSGIAPQGVCTLQLTKLHSYCSPRSDTPDSEPVKPLSPRPDVSPIPPLFRKHSLQGVGSWSFTISPLTEAITSPGAMPAFLAG